MFKTAKGVSVMRSPLESLLHGICLHMTIISAWAELLNYEERFRKKAACHAYFVQLICWDMKIEVLDNNASAVTFEAKYNGWPKKLKCLFNLFGQCWTPSNHEEKTSGTDQIEDALAYKSYKIDCGIFVMRHMETYKGTTVKNWESGLLKECTNAGEISYKQHKELDELRHKYVAKMVLSVVNILRPFVEDDVGRYKKLTNDQKTRLEAATFDTILARLDN
ncbi:hypothetical protein HanIR_Chr10g0457161 [Helianthus annuus]|nr:hypothetical protein HanIR_Chr10g0457161 [Helianthus annuus]